MTIIIGNLATKLAAQEILAAAKAGQVQVVWEKIQDGVAVDSQDEHGKTPIYYACCAGHLPVALLLLDKGANINHRATNPSGWTPLHGAAWFGQAEMVSWLLKAGAKATQNGEGESPATLCRRGQHYAKDMVNADHGQVIQLLKAS